MAATDGEDDFTLAISSPEETKPRFPYMGKLVKASSVINMWPKSKKTNSVLYHTKVWIIVFICIALILTFAIKIVKEFKDLDSVAQPIDFVTVFISGTFRYLYVYVRGDGLVYLVSLIHNDFIQYPIIPNARRMSLEKHYNLARKLSLAYGTFTLSWILQICTIPVVRYAWEVVNLPPNSNETVPYPMPMKVYAPFDYQKQKAPVIAAFYIHQSVGYMMIGWIYVVTDSFWYMVIMLTVGQFVLIEDSLKTITEVLKKAEERDHVLNERQIHKVECGLKRCIAHHQFVTKFVRMIDDLSNPIFLVDYIHAVISIGFILLDVTISLNNGDWNKVMYSFEFFITSIVHMFLLDWMGNELTEKENELANAIYDFPWYKFPSQKSTFLLTTIHSRKPFKLTKGKMININLQYFGKTMKAVFSYFTFLLQVRNGK